jgi:hypothetical protein
VAAPEAPTAPDTSTPAVSGSSGSSSSASPPPPLVKVQAAAGGNPAAGKGPTSADDEGRARVVLAGAVTAAVCGLALLVLGTVLIVQNVQIHRGGLNLVGSPVVSEEIKL